MRKGTLVAYTGPSCCAEGCANRGVLHLFTGVVESGVAKSTQYTGGSFCSWECLAVEIKRVDARYAEEGDYMCVPIWREGQGDHAPK